jgi:hypothetical protein
MPRPPTPKKAKKAKPDFVFPPGGAAIAAVPGLRLKPRTGDVPRWWPVDKPGKAAFACNVPGVNWYRKYEQWNICHTNGNGQTTNLGYKQHFYDACTLRASIEDGKSVKGHLHVLHKNLVVSKCGQNSCRRKHVCVTEFAPDPFTHKKKFSDFQSALAELKLSASPSALQIIETLKTSNCLHCRKLKHGSHNEGENNIVAECARAILRLKDGWVRTGGCAVCGCCNPLLLQGDHEGRAGKHNAQEKLDPRYWSCNGGVDAFEAHYRGPTTTVRPLCMFCHALADSHGIYTGSSLEDLQPGSSQYQRRKNRLEKQGHVNEHKISKGTCEHPLCCDPNTGLPRVITAANVHGFHCAHIDEVDKEHTIGHLVHNTQSLRTAKPTIDRELAKCKVYCANCHHLYDTIPRRKEGRELLDALLARGAPVCGVCE